MTKSPGIEKFGKKSLLFAEQDILRVLNGIMLSWCAYMGLFLSSIFELISIKSISCGSGQISQPAWTCK